MNWRVRDKGLSEERFTALVAQKNLEYQKLPVRDLRAVPILTHFDWTAYALAAVVDIAPEQYPEAASEFPQQLTVDMLEIRICQQLSQEWH